MHICRYDTTTKSCLSQAFSYPTQGGFKKKNSTILLYHLRIAKYNSAPKTNLFRHPKLFHSPSQILHVSTGPSS